MIKTVLLAVNELLIIEDSATEISDEKLNNDLTQVAEKYKVNESDMIVLNDTKKWIMNKSVIRKAEAQFLARCNKLYLDCIGLIPQGKLAEQEEKQFYDATQKLFMEERTRWNDTPLTNYSKCMLVCLYDKVWDEYKRIAKERVA